MCVLAASSFYLFLRYHPLRSVIFSMKHRNMAYHINVLAYKLSVFHVSLFYVWNLATLMLGASVLTIFTARQVTIAFWTTAILRTRGDAPKLSLINSLLKICVKLLLSLVHITATYPVLSISLVTVCIHCKFSFTHTTD